MEPYLTRSAKSGMDSFHVVLLIVNTRVRRNVLS
jgi:hypothetical protein